MLTDDEKIAYLANVLSIGTADGGISPEESPAIRWIMNRIHADEPILRRAATLLESGEYRLQFMTSPAQRMANIEDMVMAALADDELDKAETRPIERLASALKFSQTDMDMLITRANARLKRLPPEPDLPPEPPKMKPPPPPPQANSREPAPRFSPRRPRKPIVPKRTKTPPKPPAKPLSAPAQSKAVMPAQPPAAPTPPPLPRRSDIPESGIVVEFTGPAGTALDEALRALESAESRGKNTLAGATWHYAVWSENRPSQAAMAALAISSLPGRRVYVRGEEQPWDRLFAFCPCARHRLDSDEPIEYCFGAPEGPLIPWGCRHSAMPWTPDASWFAHGAFEDDETYRFDKEAICRSLQQNLSPYRYCPFLSETFANAAIEHLPERVRAWGGWTYREPKGQERVFRRVRTQRFVQGCPVSTAVAVTGVSPVSVRPALAMIRRAAADSGIPPPAHARLHRTGMQAFRTP